MSVNYHDQLANVLLVEDSMADIELFKIDIEFENIQLNLSIARDGEDAISFLNKEEFSSDFTPDIILLDINLPKINGLEVLSYIKENENLNHIPVVILSGSENKSDFQKSQALGAEGYLIKPLSKEDFDDITSMSKNLYFDREGSESNLCSKNELLQAAISAPPHQSSLQYIDGVFM